MRIKDIKKNKLVSMAYAMIKKNSESALQSNLGDLILYKFINNKIYDL